MFEGERNQLNCSKMTSTSEYCRFRFRVRGSSILSLLYVLAVIVVKSESESSRWSSSASSCGSSSTSDATSIRSLLESGREMDVWKLQSSGIMRRKIRP